MPIIPGIKPITTKQQMLQLPKIFNINLPENLTEEIERCKTDEEVEKVGIAWSIEQCKELIKHGVPVLHFYTMGKSKTTAEIAKAIF